MERWSGDGVVILVMRPTSLLRLSLLRLLDSNIPLLRIKIVLESNPLNSTMLVGRLGVYTKVYMMWKVWSTSLKRREKKVRDTNDDNTLFSMAASLSPKPSCAWGLNSLFHRGYTIMHYTILYYTILYYTIIYYNILYYTIL